MSLIDSDLTDDQLKSLLKEAGIDHGPINDSTRHLYVNLYKRGKNTKPIKKSSLQKKYPSPPKSPPNALAKKPNLKRSSSDTRQDGSPSRNSRPSNPKRLKRFASSGLSASDISTPCNGTHQLPTPSSRRATERSIRSKSLQESQDSDVSTTSTLGSDGSQPTPLDNPLIDKNTRLLPSIPEEPMNGIKMKSDGITGLFQIPSPPLFAIPRIAPNHRLPAVPKPLKHLNGNTPPPPPPPQAPCSSSNASYRPLLCDRKQWPGWSEGERKKDWELSPDSLTIRKTSNGKDWRLGMGGYCEVFRGQMHQVDDVAVKVCKILNKQSLDPFKREIELISKLHHRNVLQFYGACLNANNIFMVTELMDVDLFTALKSDPKVLWSGEYGWNIARDIALGMNYLHRREPTVVHRDLKSSNVLLHRYIAKIGDVGIARFMTQENMTAQNSYTLAWAAPEVVYRHRATEKIDIWSFGIILWEIVTGNTPSTGYLSMPYWCPENIQSIYLRCIFDEANLRPTAAEIVQSLDSIQEK